MDGLEKVSNRDYAKGFYRRHVHDKYQVFIAPTHGHCLLIYLQPNFLSYLSADAYMPQIVFEDDFILLINKPSGLLSVPGKTIHDSAWSRMAERYDDLRMVHRLDCDTSGLMLFAKCREAQSSFGRQFQQREVSKVYQAVVSGHCFFKQARVDLPLICDWPNRPLQMVNYNYGKPSQTDWKVLKEIGSDSLMELTPVTGRSHQLRVHMKSIGHTILGDRFYATPDVQEQADRLMLHAWKLDFNHPIIGDRMSFQCDWNVEEHLR